MSGISIELANQIGDTLGNTITPENKPLLEMCVTMILNGSKEWYSTALHPLLAHRIVRLLRQNVVDFINQDQFQKIISMFSNLPEESIYEKLKQYPLHVQNGVLYHNEHIMLSQNELVDLCNYAIENNDSKILQSTLLILLPCETELFFSTDFAIKITGLPFMLENSPRGEFLRQNCRSVILENDSLTLLLLNTFFDKSVLDRITSVVVTKQIFNFLENYTTVFPNMHQLIVKGGLRDNDHEITNNSCPQNIREVVFQGVYFTEKMKNFWMLLTDRSVALYRCRIKSMEHKLHFTKLLSLPKKDINWDDITTDPVSMQIDNEKPIELTEKQYNNEILNFFFPNIKSCVERDGFGLLSNIFGSANEYLFPSKLEPEILRWFLEQAEHCAIAGIGMRQEITKWITSQGYKQTLELMPTTAVSSSDNEIVNLPYLFFYIEFPSFTSFDIFKEYPVSSAGLRWLLDKVGRNINFDDILQINKVMSRLKIDKFWENYSEKNMNSLDTNQLQSFFAGINPEERLNVINKFAGLTGWYKKYQENYYAPLFIFMAILKKPTPWLKVVEPLIRGVYLEPWGITDHLLEVFSNPQINRRIHEIYYTENNSHLKLFAQACPNLKRIIWKINQPDIRPDLLVMKDISSALPVHIVWEGTGLNLRYKYLEYLREIPKGCELVIDSWNIECQPNDKLWVKLGINVPVYFRNVTINSKTAAKDHPFLADSNVTIEPPKSQDL